MKQKSRLWTYVAEFDALWNHNGIMAATFRDSKGEEYNCPTISSKRLFKKAKHVYDSSSYAHVSVKVIPEEPSLAYKEKLQDISGATYDDLIQYEEAQQESF